MLVKPITRSISQEISRSIVGTPIDPDAELRALIQSLYGNGETGAFYIPQPVVLGQQALFQDSTGTVPATADGDPVGLMLDLSEGLVTGSNKWDDTSDVSVIGGSYKVSDGVYRLLSSDGSYTSFTLEGETLAGGVWYRVSYSVRSYSSGSVRFRSSNAIRSGNGDFAEVFLAMGEDSLFFKRGSGETDMLIENVKIEELYGSHAYQDSSASRPTYSEDAPMQVYDGVDDSLLVPVSIASASIALVRESGVTITTTVDMSSGYSLTESNSGAIIIDRELTSNEVAAIEAYFS